MKITCRINMFFFVCVVTLVSLLSACGGGGGDTPSTTTTTPPATAIKTTIDEQNRVTAVIPPTGGTITTTGQDGTQYTLSFPLDSVASETQVSIAPVLSVSGAPFQQGFVGGLNLSPEGLQFDTPIELNIEPASSRVGVFPISMLISNDGTDTELIPVQVNGDVYVAEVSHFSTALTWDEEQELLDETAEYVKTRMYDMFYGPLGLVTTLQAIESCSDFRFIVLAQQVADINALYDAYGAWAEQYTEPLVPRQCTGFLGGFTPTGCETLFELADAARSNLADALEYFTRQSTQKCLDGDPVQEADAFQCIRNAYAWEGLIHTDEATLCEIKAQCGIASLKVEPAPLELAVGESGQITAVPRDLAGAVLADREIQWLEKVQDSDIAKLSALDIANPLARGIFPGYARPIAVDLMGQFACQGITYAAAEIDVTNRFIIEPEPLIVPEGDTAELRVKLDYPVDFGVTATISRVSGDTDVTIAAGEELTFKPDNWDQFQSVLLFAFEDDDDIENGTAIIRISDTWAGGGFESKVASKEVVVREADNDGASMFITPDTLCVEAGRTARLSVLANQFVDLNAIRWSSSDNSVATVDSAGQVSAQSAGPVRITADLIPNQDVLASAFATLEVRNSCAIIATPDYPKKRKTCIHAALSPAFETENDRIQVDAYMRTPQDGFKITWGSDHISTMTVELIDEDSAQVHGITGGTGTVELTVDNVVTEYHASLPIDVVRLPDGYRGVGLTLPFVSGKPHALKDNREIVPYTELEQTLTDAVIRCGLDSESILDRMAVTNWHESGKVIGIYVTDTSNTPGFVFDLNTCDLDFFSAPLPHQMPAGDDMVSETHPTSISADGTIVGYAHWHVYGDWCDQNPDWSCTYTVDTGFVLQNGMFSFPFLPPNTPYADPYYFTTLDAINDVRTALFYSSQSNSSALYNLDDSTFKLVPEGYRALNDHGHVVGTNFSPWFYSNGEYPNLMPQFASGISPSILFPDQINEAEDILAHGRDQDSSNFEHYLLYLCPPSVENKTALFVDDRNVIEGYEQSEISCDGRDNDLDGFVDESLHAPFNTKQAGVCEGSLMKCEGRGGWVDDYSLLADYEFPEVTCDGKDNDCDGIPDEGCPPSVATIQ